MVCLRQLITMAVFMGIAAGPAAGQGDTFDHFCGVYAFEASPYWPEFEVRRSESGFSLSPAADTSDAVALTVSDAGLSGSMEGDPFTIRHNPAGGVYTLDRVADVSTWSGRKKMSEQLRMVKIKPNPTAELERTYSVKAAALVRGVRSSEDWIGKVRSFRVTATDKWTKTPEGIAHSRQQLQEQFPDLEVTDKRFPELKPVLTGELDLLFDQTRFRYYNDCSGNSRRLHIWNGREFVAHEKYYSHDQEHYAFRREIPDFQPLLLDLTWPRSKHHAFWWQPERNNVDWEHHFGRAEEYILVGKEPYRGTDCFAVEYKPADSVRVSRWYIGAADGLKYAEVCFTEGQKTWEWWTADYRQVRPGWWFPMAQGYHMFENDGKRQSFVAGTREITIESVQIDQVFPESLFTIDFRDGVDVNDDRYGGFIVYKYKKDRTPQEWEELYQQARQRQESDDAEKKALDERIGQPAPEFGSECKWVHTEPLTWQKLGGRAVVLQFWSVSCGPFHNYMGMLSKSDNERVCVIGMHTPTDNLEEIRSDMARYKADGPVCVDAGPGWGTLHNWYRVKRMPYWVVVGPDGKVVGHFDNPHEARQAAEKAFAPKN